MAVGPLTLWQHGGSRIGPHGAGGSGPVWFGTALMGGRSLGITGPGTRPAHLKSRARSAVSFSGRIESRRPGVASQPGGRASLSCRLPAASGRRRCGRPRLAGGDTDVRLCGVAARLALGRTTVRRGGGAKCAMPADDSRNIRHGLAGQRQRGTIEKHGSPRADEGDCGDRLIYQGLRPAATRHAACDQLVSCPPQDQDEKGSLGHSESEV